MTDNKGFTLIELMIVLAITSGVIAGTYWTFASQNRAYGMQEEVARMQQNLRTAMYIMGREIRMAGYDPTEDAGATILTANANSITFTMDDNIDGTLDADLDGAFDNSEGITYSLYDYPATVPDGDMDIGRDPDGNGVPGSGVATNQPLAENIDALDFVYLDGSNPPVVLNPGGGNVPAANLPNIRAVQITIVARADRIDRQYSNIIVYNNPQGFPIPSVPPFPKNDNFHRHILTTTVTCRNMGL